VSYELRIANCELRATSCELRVVSCELRAASCISNSRCTIVTDGEGRWTLGVYME